MEAYLIALDITENYSLTSLINSIDINNFEVVKNCLPKKLSIHSNPSSTHAQFLIKVLMSKNVEGLIEHPSILAAVETPALLIFEIKNSTE